MRPSSPVCPPAAQRRSQHTTQCSAHVGTRGSDIRPLFPPSRPSAWQVTRLLHPSEGRYACITLGQEHVIGGASGERLITRAHAVHVPLWLRSLSTPGSCAPPRLHIVEVNVHLTLFGSSPRKHRLSQLLIEIATRKRTRHVVKYAESRQSSD